MKILTFQAESFSWEPFSQTIDDADEGKGGAVEAAVVAFLHVEKDDFDDDRRASVFKQTLKHLKWLANKRELRRVVLHSFTHLGGQTARSGEARELFDQLRERLEGTGYEVSITPFGWFCSWSLAVYGDSLAKVFKEIR